MIVPIIALLLVGVGVAVMGWAIVRALKKDVKPLGEGLPMPYEVSAQTRNALRPIRTLQEEIEAITRENKGNPIVNVVGMEAAAEARLMVEKAYHLAQEREKLSQTARRQTMLDQDLALLEMEAATGIGTPQGAAAEAKLRTARLQQQQAQMAAGKVALIDEALANAEAALVELKAKLTGVTLGDQIEVSNGREELDSMVQRIKSLSRSLDEADATLNERS